MLKSLSALKASLKTSQGPAVAFAYRAATGAFDWVIINIVNPVRTLRMRLMIRKYERLVEREYERAIDLAIRYIKAALVDGAIAEFGCQGRTAAAECRHLAAFQMRRDLHLFDSFQGAPSFTDDDRLAPEVVAKVWSDERVPASLSARDLRHKLKGIYDGGQVYIYEGYFSETLGKIPASTRFAMIVMDSVTYSSTFESLDWLFSNRLVSEGAVFLMSSWNVSRGSPTQSTRRAWNEAVEKHGVQYSDEGRYNWGGARFIVHGYGNDRHSS